MFHQKIKDQLAERDHLLEKYDKLLKAVELGLHAISHVLHK